MEKGWEARGLLKPLWGRVGGRDRLAELTGIQPSTISGYNAGRLPLGMANARKIAAALGVTVADLGAPDQNGQEPSPLMRELIAIKELIVDAVRDRHAWEAQIDGQLRSQDDLLAALTTLADELRQSTQVLVTVAERLDEATRARTAREPRRRSK